MSAGLGEIGVPRGVGRLASDRRRSVALLAVLAAAGLGAGFAVGLLFKGGAHNQRVPSVPAVHSGVRSETIPAVPALRTAAALPALRTRPKTHRASSGTAGGSHAAGSGAAGSTSAASAPSVVNSQPASGASSTPSVSPTSTTAPKQSAPPHREGGEVHHESGGGA